MQFPRRRFLRLAASAVALPALPRLAAAQAYPARPVRIVVGYPPGDSPDVVARIMGRWLADRLGRPFVIENKPGAGSNIAVQSVLDSPADGYTLIWITTANTSNASFYQSLRFNFLTDVAPVAAICRMPLVMDVNPSVPAKTVPEFIAYAKANPGKVNMASAGVGGLIHLAGELFKTSTGLDLPHVPYRGSPPALTDLMSGRVQVMFDALATSLPHIRSGALRALAVTTPTRSDALPNVPTVGDTVPGYEAGVWLGIGAPRGTPADIIATLNRELNAGLADPSIKAQLADLGMTPIPETTAEFATFLAAETDKWGKVIRTLGIRAE
ncbi:MAG TPA: tripartite tricarboxylate transporter substrate binding protein [Xanthobacteraceae bacterium]|jgi:tripartite-type tricarboxylate transporter receptor subunit TctC|nr:tripartite tricarboxylate transporter substrate binding protein [Xanthobacteraceae bacterium]